MNRFIRQSADKTEIDIYKDIVVVCVVVYLQGGPAKVRQTYIFDGNISMHS